MKDRDRRAGPRRLTEKELALLKDHSDRQDRYIRTALFVQSKWFMIGGAAAIAAMLLLMFLVG